MLYFLITVLLLTIMLFIGDTPLMVNFISNVKEFTGLYMDFSEL